MLFNYRLQGKLYTDFKRQYVSRQYQEMLETKTTMKLPSLYRLFKKVNIFSSGDFARESEKFLSALHPINSKGTLKIQNVEFSVTPPLKRGATALSVWRLSVRFGCLVASMWTFTEVLKFIQISKILKTTICFKIFWATLIFDHSPSIGRGSSLEFHFTELTESMSKIWRPEM